MYAWKMRTFRIMYELGQLQSVVPFEQRHR